MSATRATVSIASLRDGMQLTRDRANAMAALLMATGLDQSSDDIARLVAILSGDDES